MAEQDIALMSHLMRRAGFGASRDEIEAKAAQGYDRWAKGSRIVAQSLRYTAVSGLMLTMVWSPIHSRM